MTFSLETFEFGNNTLSQIEMTALEFFPGLTILLIATAGLVQIYLKKKKKRNYGFSNKQRNERKRISLPLLINTPITHEFSVNTFDISLTGAFLAYEDLQHSMSFTSLIGKRTGVKIGDLIDIKIYIGRFSQLSCQAKVVRYNFSNDSLSQKGIGLEFVGLSKRKKKILSNLIYSDFSQKTA